jgi:5-formyltetrahydrofolate cyclo-ligase
MDHKGDIRKRVLALRDALTEAEIAAKSERIVEGAAALAAFREAETLMVYLSFGSEARIDGLIDLGRELGKAIAVPLCRPASRELIPCRIDGFTDLQTGHYGIREPRPDRIRPVPAERIDAVLVPGVAFDRRGYRIGYGGGYYDRFLPRAVRAARIGVAFACQIVETLPAEGCDVPVARILTEEETLPAG